MSSELGEFGVGKFSPNVLNLNSVDNNSVVEKSLRTSLEVKFGKCARACF